MSIRKEIAMDTLITIRVTHTGADQAVDRAFRWFHEIEDRCSRFDPRSELMQLTSNIGIPVAVSDLLFECVQFALKVAEETKGAFDPAIGHQMESRGFNRAHRTGQIVHTAISSTASVSYKDVHLDSAKRTIQLARPLIIDLGAVAKGLALDVAAQELQPFQDFSIDAGGDLYLGGCNPQGNPWHVGIRHPSRENAFIYELSASNQAVCTSGCYERGRHILDPRTGRAAESSATVTVVAPNAMLADALATAAFVLGPIDGIALLERMGVNGVIVAPDLELYETPGLKHAA